MANILSNITVAALLHDIGKMYQRAGTEVDDFNFTYCPKFGGKESHLHVAHTAQFISNYFDSEKYNLNKFFITGDEEVSVVNLAASHHNPSNKYHWIIAAADRLASGFERTAFEDYNSEDWENKQQADFRKSRLISVFSQVSLKNQDGKKHSYYPLKPLNYGILPAELEELTETDAQKEYKELKNQFEEDLQVLFRDQHINFEDFLNALIALLEKYLWCVPSSSFKTLADVSLFDHVKTTAAIANALYIYHVNNSENENFSLEEVKDFDNNEEKFILAKGDFSGIQDFIFSKFGESNKYAAKILRAKSLYVSVFTEAVAHLLCKEFQVNSANIVINAGGHFMVVLPNLKNSEERLEKFFSEISLVLEKLTYGQTRFNYAYEFVSGGDFSSKNISQKIDSLNHKLGINKLKRPPQITVFEDYLKKVNESNGVCEFDGFRPKSHNSNFSAFTYYMKKLGEILPKSKYLILHFGDISEIELKHDELIPVIEGRLYFALSNSPLKSKTTLNFTLDDFKGVGVKRIANYVPVFSEEDINNLKYTEIPEKIFDQSDFKSGKIKSFYHIAVDAKQKDEKSNEYRGKAFLGILKADVDNLGLIFSKGFKKETVNFAKIVSLSRMLDFFFTGWLTFELKNNFRSVYTVFAGGDDLFLIGPYNQIAILVERINFHFKEYVKNEEIHFSAGVIIEKPQIPVYQMATNAEKMLNLAKKSGKNKIAIFNCIVAWDEYNKLIQMKELFKKYFDEYSMSTSYMYKLLKFIQMKTLLDHAIQNEKKITLRDIENAKWVALFKYTTYRNFKENQGRDEILTTVKKLIDEFGENLLIPITLTLYERRN